MVILFPQAVSGQSGSGRKMLRLLFAAFLKTNGGTSIMSKKNRRAAALIRQLAAAAVIPLTVLTMALTVRPA